MSRSPEMPTTVRVVMRLLAAVAMALLTFVIALGASVGDIDGDRAELDGHTTWFWDWGLMAAVALLFGLATLWLVRSAWRIAVSDHQT